MAVNTDTDGEIDFGVEQPQIFVTKDEAMKWMKESGVPLVIYEVKPIAKSIQTFAYEELESTEK